MRLPVEEISNYLGTTEMYEIMQENLNEDEKITHNIIGTSIFIEAFHDKDLDILWTVYIDKKTVHDSVATDDLQSIIEYAIKGM